jgi:hypothetical protein
VTNLVLPDRKRALILLAEHLYDSLAGPKGQRFHHGTGQAAPSHYEPCQACGGTWRTGSLTGVRYGVNPGTGWTTDRFGRKHPCEACGGRTDEDGSLHKGAGRVGMDSMTGRKVGTEEAPAKRSSSWVCNFCFGLGVKHGKRCEPCAGSGRREHSAFVLAGVSDEPDGTTDFELPAFDRAIDERDKAGDFHRLEIALGELARRSPHYWRTFHAVHVVKTRRDFELDYRARVWLQQAYATLLNLMPAEIRVPRDLVYAERAKREQRPAVRGRVDMRALGDRNAWMREEFSSGRKDLAALMRETGLQRSQVYEVIYGEAS